MPENYAHNLERQTIVVAGGPGGLPLGTVLASGVLSYSRSSTAVRRHLRHAGAIARTQVGTLLGLPLGGWSR